MQSLHRAIRVVLYSALILMIAVAAQAITITLSTPLSGQQTYHPNGTITYNGHYSYASGESVTTGVLMFSMRMDPDPTKGTIDNSSTARRFNVVNNSAGGGSGDFDSYNVTPPLEAPNTHNITFYVTAAPIHVNGYYYQNNDPMKPIIFDSSRCLTD